MHRLQFAKDLRLNQTDVESLLWSYLRNRQLKGLKFRRQVPIETFIVDFVCFERKSIIEVDGGQHNETININKDAASTKYFSDNGFKVLRFWNNEVINNVEGVVESILQTL